MKKVALCVHSEGDEKKVKLKENICPSEESEKKFFKGEGIFCMFFHFSRSGDVFFFSVGEREEEEEKSLGKGSLTRVAI